MAQGRCAAGSAHRLALGKPLRYQRAYAGPVVTDFDIRDARGVHPRPRAEPRLRSHAQKDFAEADETFDRETAQKEAGRCHSCGQPVGFYRTCWFCLPCEVECPHDALWVEVPYLLR
jgi:formate dehydrogenase major subunit